MVSDPFHIRGKARASFFKRSFEELERLVFPKCRRNPNSTVGFAVGKSDPATIGGPINGIGKIRQARNCGFVSAWIHRAFFKHASEPIPAAVRRENNPSSIGGPDRTPLIGGIQGQAGSNSTNDLNRPDVTVATVIVRPIENHSAPARRDTGLIINARRSEGAQRRSLTIEPCQPCCCLKRRTDR